MAHQHLCFQSLYGLQSNTNHDDDGGAADCQILNAGNQITANDGQQGNNCQIYCAKHNDLIDYLLDEFCRRLAGTEAGDETGSY